MTDKLNEFYYDSDSGELDENSCEQFENMETENTKRRNTINKKCILCEYVHVSSTANTTLPVIQQNTRVCENAFVLQNGMKLLPDEQVQNIIRDTL